MKVVFFSVCLVIWILQRVTSSAFFNYFRIREALVPVLWHKIRIKQPLISAFFNFIKPWRTDGFHERTGKELAVLYSTTGCLMFWEPWQYDSKEWHNNRRVYLFLIITWARVVFKVWIWRTTLITAGVYLFLIITQHRVVFSAEDGKIGNGYLLHTE